MAVFLSILLISLISGSQGGPAKILESFIVHELVPDILSQPPSSVLSVAFESGVSVSEGNEVTIEDVEGVPVLAWGAQEGVYYTIVMCDADPPSRANPKDRSFLHWLVVNAQNDDVTSGETIVDILNSNPEPGTGLHRYVFLVYKQEKKITFEDATLNASFDGRVKFWPDDFAAMYSLGGPIAGNFYQTQNIE